MPRALGQLPGPYPCIQALALFDTQLLLATVGLVISATALDKLLEWYVDQCYSSDWLAGWLTALLSG